MSNIDKQGRQVQRFANYGVDMMEWVDGGYVKHSDYLALQDELEAKDTLNAELMEKQRLIDICQGQGLEHRIAAEKRAEAAEKRIAELEAPAPELKMAHLINKFYERYPLAEFKSDTERSAALGYFMAGAELQCFGEFINYAELMGDE
ncbi:MULTISPECIES: hypothetical protein [Enterobacter]|uniref:hypothetical protein n=1 Tax=Enterobacter TaxID=547 RepID=UPI001D008043|nr:MULTISPECIES: hypothetical protein [Enterobacter]